MHLANRVCWVEQNCPRNTHRREVSMNTRSFICGGSRMNLVSYTLGLQMRENSTRACSNKTVALHVSDMMML